ncbi:FMN-binding protein [Paenibacillus sp. Soil787]|uniref:FMN-binding protein n=1 Tax=Paenibacillus sp. Soil787 TaxID=1736411 RepID=UPI0007031CF5|nr:FMN-binding protein [Paenibacillus sp. Soil787]KRF18490.1 FMN-binding protein [Paenibacillus sp. Soil787]
MAKMDKKWVVLCTTAIGVIYSAGYLTTETQATLQEPQQQIKTNIHSVSSQLKSQYKNGTFEGSGSNRRGSIGVQVTIINDKITDVDISHFAMHYSKNDVVGLPQEVIQKQSAQVKNVSGATYSTQAFQDAIENALKLARKA